MFVQFCAHDILHKLTQVVFIVEVIAAVVHSCGLRGEYPLSLENKTENQAGAAHANNCCKSYCNHRCMIILSSLWAACAGPANIHKQDKST